MRGRNEAGKVQAVVGEAEFDEDGGPEEDEHVGAFDEEGADTDERWLARRSTGSAPRDPNR